MRFPKPSIPFVFVTSLAAQAPSAPAGAPLLPADTLPVREVTVFKDGHAYVLREGPLPQQAGGKVVLEELPEPVLGTFWPYASEGAKLVAARASRVPVEETETALDLRQVARANVGKAAVVVTADKERIAGTLLAVPVREPRPGGAEAKEGELLLVATASSTRAVPLAQVREIEVQGEFAPQVHTKKLRGRLELQIEGGGADSRVGLVYVQHGLRWVPAYRLDVDGAGKAAVQLEATLQNDLVDFERATVHLVIGVPRFEFAGQVDPIALQQEAAEVAANVRGRARTAQFLSNAIQTQVLAGDVEAGAPPERPEVEGSAAAEDLFVFTVRDVSLKKGERLVLPIATFELPYRDVYTLEIPFAPPAEVRQHFGGGRELQLAQELAAPRAEHVLRLTNTSAAPLTTAPALVFAQGRVLAQGRLRYTPRGTDVDLAVGIAVDVGVEITDREVERGKRVVQQGGREYSAIGIAGAVTVRNGKPHAIELEVTRRVLGVMEEVGQEGAMVQLDVATLWRRGEQPSWWGWWDWPGWWFRHNGFGEFRWRVRLEPGASATLDAKWHYWWT